MAILATMAFTYGTASVAVEAMRVAVHVAAETEEFGRRIDEVEKLFPHLRKRTGEVGQRGSR